MNFLAPLFLLGALAVALPVIFHLIRRTSREKTLFSSLMFLMPTPPRVTRRSRLENIFLLILRCVVLCLLALGFARPFIQHPLQADANAGAGKKIVILLDTSASMRRANLWADARAKASEIVRQASPVDQIALFGFDRQINRLITFEQWSTMAANDRAPYAAKLLDQMSPGWSATHLGNALVGSAEALEENNGPQPEKVALRRIILISDLQEGSRLDTLQAYEWPKGVDLQIEPVKAKRPTNAGLQLSIDSTETESAAADADIRVRVSNSSDSKREQFQVGWASAGQPGFVGPPVDVYVPPGQSRVLAAPKTPPGFSGERLILTGDDDDFDNTIYVVPPRAEQVNVVFLGDDAEKDPTQCLYYLQRAFQQTRRQAIQVNSWPAGAPPTKLEQAPLVISTDNIPREQADALSRLLQNGKTVLLALKGAGAATRTLAQLVATANLSVEEAPTNNYAMFGQIDFEHPLFAPFSAPRFSDFTKIHFWKHRRLNVDKVTGAKVLARFDNGDPALLQLPVGKGVLLVLTSSWQPSDSQLALSSKFVPLLYSILEQSGGIKMQLSQYTVGDPVPLPALDPGTNRTVNIRKPDGSQVQVNGNEALSQTDLPGIYKVTLAGAATQSEEKAFQFAINLEAGESKTAPLPMEELERLGVPVKAHLAENARQLERKRLHLQAAELENRQKLWRWLIATALIVLVSETFLAGWITRRGSAAAEAP